MEIARQAEVAIIFVGDDSRTIGESRGRVNLDFSGRQQELIRAVEATGTPVVLVLFNGRPVTMNWEVKNIPAIVEAWYPGEFSGQVVAEALWGEFNRREVVRVISKISRPDPGHFLLSLMLPVKGLQSGR